MTSNPRTVADLMSEDVVTLGRNDALSIADNVMSLGRIRHMPVVDEEGALCGVVSQRDLFRGALTQVLGYGSVARTRIMKTIVVKEVMTTAVLTARAATPVSEAAELMIAHKIGCLPILDEDDRLVGILTEGDFVKLVASPAREGAAG